MKIKNNFIAVSMSLASVVLIASCKKSDFAINKSPDSVTDASVSYAEIMPASLQSTSRIVATDWSFLQNYMGYWARNGDFQPSVDEETYAFTTNWGPSTAIWNDLYANANNYNIAQGKAKAAGAGIYEGISRIMKAHAFQLLVDVFGNVPYSTALQGTVSATPTYDKGVDIYKDLFRELDAAIVTLKSASAAVDKNPQIATTDFVFAGDTNKWIKFANTLKLRMLVHVYQVSGFDIAGEMAKITAEGSGYLGAGETAQINPGFTDTKPTPYYRTYVKNESGTVVNNQIRANKYAIDYYNFDGDPRVNRFYVAPSAGGAQTGITYGALPNTNLGGTKLSTVNGPGLLPNGSGSRAWILTSVESLFLQAEARQRGIITTGTAASILLTNAVRESFVFLGLTSAQADTYIAGNATYPDVDYFGVSQGPGLPAGGIFTILSQKWFALNSIATYEVWSDFRRTDVVIGAGGGFTAGPPVSILPGVPAGTKIPVRLLYPQNEYNYNATNVAAQGTVSKFTSRVFWDLN